MRTLTLPVFLFLTALAAGAALMGCAGRGPSPPQAPTTRAAAESLSFQDVTAQAGLSAFRHETGASGDKLFPETMGSGGGFLDYDGDGWQDVLLVGGGAWDAEQPVRALWLYRNNGDGTFTDRTEAAGLAGIPTYGMGFAAADYDNDGDQDLYLTTLYENLLLRNDGGVFTDVSAGAGVAGERTWSSAAVFFDADRDGWLDLFVGQYVDWSPEKDVWCSLTGQDKGYCTPEVYRSVPPRFYRNEGDGTFTDRTEAAGFAGVPGNTLGAAELDFNDDGWPDLAVANDLQRDLLFENLGDGTFRERGMMSGIAFDQNGRARAGMGIDAGDVDNNGAETIFVGNFSNEMIGVYRHAGRGVFIDRAAVSRIGRASLPTLTFGMFLFDPDLDGDLDLLVANGHVQTEIEKVQDGVTYRQAPQLFLNQGDGTFDESGGRIGGVLARPLVARGAAYADYDRDGDLDVLLTENGGPAHLWRNEIRSGRLPEGGPGGPAAGADAVADADGPHVLRVRLQGRRNRDGLGAQVVAWTGGTRMTRRIRTGSSYLSQSEPVATFGLGDRPRVDSLVVRWPGGGRTVLTDVAGDQELVLTEAAGVAGRVEKR